MKEFKLDNYPKINSGFDIPENYFSDLAKKINNRLDQKEVKVISIFKTTKFWIAAVAAVVVISISIPLHYANSKANIIATEDYLTYEANLTSYDIIEQLSDDDITAIEESLKITDAETANYINDYL